MTASISNRKRSREEDGNGEDHMPLSKRINMLHINNNNNNNYNVDSNQQQHDHNNIELMSAMQQQAHHSNNYMNGGINTHNGNHHDLHNGHNNHHHQIQHQHLNHHEQNGNLVHHHHHLPSSHIEIENNSTYNPELNQIENPYYYNKNKLLFELHLERSKRTSISNKI